MQTRLQARLQAHLSRKDGSTVIELQGRFDFNAQSEFREAVDAALGEPAAEIRVDFSGVDYIDSSALGMLLVLRDKARGAAKSVVLAGTRGIVRQVIDIANFGRLFVLV